MLASIFNEALRAFKRRGESRSESKDRERIAARFPALAALPAATAESARLLAEPYEQYVTSVSSPVWAISLQTAALLHALCTLLKPAAVLDLGSGFSSFVFQQYSRAAAPPCTVHSVDEDLQWLDRTRNFLALYRLPTDSVFLWTAFQELPAARYDLILHDIGRLPLRLNVLPRALGVAAANGLIVLDDMHTPAYAPAAIECCRDVGFEVCSARAITLDQYGRYACLAFGRRN